MKKVLLVAAAALALTGCTTKLGSSSPATPMSAPVTTTASAGSRASGIEVTTAVETTTAQSQAPATSAPKFPNTQPYVQLVGYDEPSNMLMFRVLTRHPRDGMQDEYDYDPADPATHRLPMSESVRIHGIQGGDSSICPDATDGECQPFELISVVRAGQPTLIVQLVVDGSDQITDVAEQIGAIL